MRRRKIKWLKRQGFFKDLKNLFLEVMFRYAVGVIIRAHFKIVSSMVNDILMPLIAALFGKASFADLFSIIGQKLMGHLKLIRIEC